MLTGLAARETRVIIHYTGMLVLAVAAAMLVPLATALLAGEWAPATDYVFGAGVTALLGVLMMSAAPRDSTMGRQEALIVTALAWLAASLVAAIPLMLSGHYGGYIDALLDTMSGFTTSGLTLAQDLDHMPLAHNMWRHLTHLIGGQGIVVAALTVAFGMRGGGAVSLYHAEGRDERIMPNIMYTARFIWFVTAVFVVLGTVSLMANNLYLGMEWGRSFLHAFWNTAACFDTGGFGPQSQNALYYHSGTFELITCLLMLAGMVNFNLHARIWRGERIELFRDIEARTLAIHISLLCLAVGLGLGATALYPGPAEVVRKGVYHIISAHSGTGQQTLYPLQWTRGYGDLALVAVILAMAAGGMASSTAGGIKAIRMALTVKGISLRAREAIAPASAIVTGTYHHLRKSKITSDMLAGVAAVTALYVITYVTGGLIGLAYGYPVRESIFESISAAANVGLSTGVTTPTMPYGLKVTYIVQMWIGRLEFIAVIGLIASLAASVRFALKSRPSR